MPSLGVGKHEKTLEAMRQPPKPSNLRWTDIEALLVHHGASVKEGKGSAITVVLNGKKGYFHRPHPTDKADKGAIESALELLRQAGVI
jgi:hypothetical protein